MLQRKGLRLRHLEVLHWIMTRGTLTGAAEALNTSQPTVSRDLAELERILGVQMFIRDGRRIRPTQEAEFIHDEIARNYLSADLLYDLAEQVTGGSAGRLRIASVPSLALRVVPEMIGALVTARPGCSVELEVHGRDTIAEMLGEHRFDVVFTVVGGPVAKGLTVEPLGTTRALCVFHPGSPLARLSHVTPADLAGQPFVSLAPNYLSRQRVDEVFLRAGIPLRTFMSTQTAIAACSVIKTGFGATIIDPMTASHALDANLSARRFEPEVSFDYIVAFPHRARSRPLVTAAIEQVRRRIATVAAEMDRLVGQA